MLKEEIDFLIEEKLDELISEELSVSDNVTARKGENLE